MLFSVEKPDTPGIYWLDHVLSTFFVNLFAVHEFNYNMFPLEFAPVLAASPETLRKFRDVHNAFTGLEPQMRQALQDIYNNHCDLINNVGDVNYTVNTINGELNAIWDNIKSLCDYLYKTTINLACFKGLDNINDDMNLHFDRFKTLNGKVCCFCGMDFYESEREIDEQMGEKQWRASYDHYLYKKKYPFSAVDFDNLFPCCHTCNEKAKNEIDVVYDEDERVPAFHPYQDHEVATIEVAYTIQTRRWTATIPAGDNLLNQKTRNWNRIFLVTSRANKLVNDSFEETWFAPIAYGKTNATEIRDVLHIVSINCHARMRVEREAYYKAKCFSAVQQASDTELEILAATVNDLYVGRVII